MALAFHGQALPIEDLELLVNHQSPSCLLLKHRAKERQKVIREIRHLMGITTSNPVTKFMEEDTLIKNKVFLDEKLWNAPAVEVVFRAKITKQMKEATLEHGFDNIILSVRSNGFSWTSHPQQFPKDVTLSYNDRILQIRYPIYMNSYCEDPQDEPSVQWLHPNQEFDSTENSYLTEMALKKTMANE